MSKKVKVQLFGRHNRHVQIDAQATEGAQVGKDLFWPDGEVIQESEIRGGSTTTTTTIPGGVGGVSITLWELIQNIPKFISSLLSISGTGLVVKGVSDTAFTRSIVPEDARITVANGDGIAGNPTIGLTDWPVIKQSIAAAETVLIPIGFQLIVAEDFDIIGTLDAQGSLVVL